MDDPVTNSALGIIARELPSVASLLVLIWMLNKFVQQALDKIVGAMSETSERRLDLENKVVDLLITELRELGKARLTFERSVIRQSRNRAAQNLPTQD